MSRASGYARRSAPMSGVVNTTSPIKRSRRRRIVNLRFDGRLVNQHDGDVVLDGIDTPALRTLERRSPLDEFDLRLAIGARQDLEQFRIDHESVPQALL